MSKTKMPTSKILTLLLNRYKIPLSNKNNTIISKNPNLKVIIEEKTRISRKILLKHRKTRKM